MAAVAHRVTGDGTHQIGVKVDGAFVPFTSMDADRVAALVENENNRTATDDHDTAPPGEKPAGRRATGKHSTSGRRDG